MGLKSKAQKPVPPVERRETIRREIVSLLDGRTFSARELSVEVRVTEKEVCEHLLHIRKSFGKKQHSLSVAPSECRKCGFVFRKRERLTRPGKCPNCLGTSITEPVFCIL